MNEAHESRLFLIDAMGYIFRAYFAPMERLRSPSGMPTKVPYLFANMLRRLVKQWEPDYLGVVYDVAAPTFRDKLFAEYKAQRPPMPEELAEQLPWVRRYCDAMRVAQVEYEGYEADDVIGTLARQAAAKGIEAFIVTSDKDFLQLVDGRVRVLIPTKSDLLIDRAKVEEMLGVAPERVPDVMALTGDSIDNVPGAKGIGEKGARGLIARFGSVEAALDHAAEVENKRYREALLGQREQVLLSKQLTTIHTNVPMELDLDALRRREPDIEALRKLYGELGFSSLLRELAPAPAEATGNYRALDSPEALVNFLAGIGPGQEAALWLETAPEEVEPGFGSRVVKLEVSAGASSGAVAWTDDRGEMLGALAQWLGDGSRPKVVHDAKLVELLAMGGKGPGARGVRHALDLYSYLLRPTTARHGLEDIASRQLNVSLGGGAGERADYLMRLAPLLRADVEAQGLVPVYEQIDLPLAPVLARMERRGVGVARTALEAFSAATEEEIRRLERSIYEAAGYEFNILSTQQLGELLFDKLNLPLPRRRGKGKVRSTAVDVLRELAPLHPLPGMVIEYRESAKLKSTYADALPRLIHPETGRIHPRFNQTGTSTGRLSCSSPNLQNIPVRTELGRKIRAGFVARPGWRLLSADYSQIELRVMAHLSADPVLASAFRRGEDVHSRTAEEVFGAGPLAQTAEHRRAAKIINFGILYGLSPFGLAAQLQIDQKEAAQFIHRYFERYRGVKEWLDGQLEQVRRTGVTRTLLGRMRPIPEINAPQAALRGLAERTALNTPVQGTAADLMKLAMIETDKRFMAEGLRAEMILQVHDELLFEVPEEEFSQVSRLVREAMEHAYPLSVPLIVEIKAGPNWRDMKSISEGAEKPGKPVE
ncbi:MAG TPA: DNA polymerase I [Candidatus Dormibacteraeota bacterium]|nr:DNA polymerase I [Candidatus Dormibacteraeota bacterium]